MPAAPGQTTELTLTRADWCCEHWQWRGIVRELHRILVFTFETQPCNDAIEVMCNVPVMCDVTL